jgi:hypothetical protein
VHGIELISDQPLQFSVLVGRKPIGLHSKASLYCTMPLHSSVPASWPFAPSVWLVRSVSRPRAHGRHGLETPGYQESAVANGWCSEINSSTPTSSTSSTDRPPHPSPPDHPRSPRCFRRIVQNLSRCLTDRTRKRMIMRSEAGQIVSSG